MNLTNNEKAVIKAFMNDCFVSDHGWQSPDAAAWMFNFHKDCGLDGHVFAGVISGMVKRDLITNCPASTPPRDNYFQLTDLGRECAAELDKETTK